MIAFCILCPAPMLHNEDVLLSNQKTVFQNILNLNLNLAKASSVFLESRKLRDSLGAFTPILRPIYDCIIGSDIYKAKGEKPLEAFAKVQLAP